MRNLIKLMLIGLLITATPSHAVLKREAQIRYQTQQGPSKWYRVQVNFLTGQELSTATSSFKYSMFKNYAVVFWGENEATVIELGGYNFCSGEYTESCLPILGRSTGKDNDGREWEICTGIIC